MLLHRYQTEAYKENGPLGSPYKGQGRILAILKLKPEISHKELSYLLGISTQSMSELLRKLESKGYVKRVPSEQDRRSMNIILTEEGKKQWNSQMEWTAGTRNSCFAVSPRRNSSNLSSSWNVLRMKSYGSWIRTMPQNIPLRK